MFEIIFYGIIKQDYFLKNRDKCLGQKAFAYTGSIPVKTSSFAKCFVKLKETKNRIEVSRHFR
jgi:hypothetical protein